MRVLVIDTDTHFSFAMKAAFQRDNIQVNIAQSLREASKQIHSQLPELVILNSAVPDGNSYEYTRSLRNRFQSEVRIMMTSQDQTEEAAILAFSSGVDEFVRKPVGFEETLLRAKRHLNAFQVMTFGELKVFPKRQSISNGNLETFLRHREFEILTALSRSPNEIVTRNELISQIGNNEKVSERALDSYVCRLRKVLSDMNVSSILIRSVYGKGYILETYETLKRSA